MQGLFSQGPPPSGSEPAHRLKIYEFPDCYVDTGARHLGSLDAIAWMTADAGGRDAQTIPAGALLHVVGWAADASGLRPAGAVVIAIDGGRCHEARVGTRRADVVTMLERPGLERSGFDALLVTAGLAIGQHALSVFAVEPEGRRYATLAEATFTIVPSRFELPMGITFGSALCAAWVDEAIDVARNAPLPIADRALAAPRGTLISLRGWAYDRTANLPVGRLYALVDGTQAFRASYGDSRPDVGTMVGVAGLAAIGYVLRIPTAELEPGAHRVELIGVDRSCDELLHGDLTLDLTVTETEGDAT